MGRISEASELAIDYINAILGKGMEHFGLETPLVATKPSVWLPFNTVELLLFELEQASNEDSSYIQVSIHYNKSSYKIENKPKKP